MYVVKSNKKKNLRIIEKRNTMGFRRQAKRRDGKNSFEMLNFHRLSFIMGKIFGSG